MYKNRKENIKREFLNKFIPEILLPYKKSLKKDKKIIREKKWFFKRIRKNLRQIGEKTQSNSDWYQNLLENLLNKKKVYNDQFIPNYTRSIQEKQDRIFKSTLTESVGSPFFTETRLSKAALTSNFTKFSRVKAVSQPANSGEKSVKDFLTKIKKSAFYGNYNQISGFILGAYTPRASAFYLKLKEKKKFSIVFGKYSKKYFRQAYLKSKKKKNIRRNLLLFFESRLDFILFRLNFAFSVYTARQMINHKNIYVNKMLVNLPNYQVKAGDYISFSEKKKKNIFLKIKKTARHFLYFAKSFKLYNKSFKPVFSKSYSPAVRQIIRKKIRLWRKGQIRKPLSYQPMNIYYPMNIAVSYKLLCAVVLYPPQKLQYSYLINSNIFSRGLIKR